MHEIDSDRLAIIEAGMYEPEPSQQRSLRTIAQDIEDHWRGPDGEKKTWYGAQPYLTAMFALDKITDNYGADPAEDIVMYFLVNAKTWRGEHARRIKKELREMIGK